MVTTSKKRLICTVIDVSTCVTTALDAAWGGSAEVGRLS